MLTIFICIDIGSSTQRVSERTGEVYTELNNALYDSRLAHKYEEVDRTPKGNGDRDDLPSSSMTQEDACYDVPNQHYLPQAKAGSDGNYVNLRQ